ncbi:GntR family transcriptional regulator [Paenarthrobacter sp. 2TAF44]|uniref:GntR family transcriptional regulator n=1 Tax=Paenarthrobacter sp. 2TAF44 TaxID=3233018 RepID=UPI003F9CAC45
MMSAPAPRTGCLTPAKEAQDLKIRVHKYSPVPLYFQIAEAISAEIQLNHLNHGDKLKTERELARELGVSLGTVRHAFQRLEDNHLVHRKQGSGTYIA